MSDDLLSGIVTTDLGGYLYMADGRCIERKPGQSYDDAIAASESPSLALTVYGVKS